MAESLPRGCSGRHGAPLPSGLFGPAIWSGLRANASKSNDPFNAKDARGAKGTQTPIRATNMAPTLNRIFLIGSGGVFGNFQTGATQKNCPQALASLAPFASFALNGCSIWAVPDGF
jgi:hypothetical protein